MMEELTFAIMWKGQGRLSMSECRGHGARLSQQMVCEHMYLIHPFFISSLIIVRLDHNLE